MALQPSSDTPLAQPVSVPPSANSLVRWIQAHENLSFLVLAPVWLLALYGRVLTAPFVSGDLDQVVFNPALSSWHDVWRQLLLAPGGLTQELRGAVPGAFYRPVYWLSLAIDRQLWGLNPVGFHATSLILALISGFTAFRLLRALRMPVLMSGAATLIWLGLPVNSEVIAWVTARAYSLSAIFVFLSLIMAAYVVERDKKPLWLLGYFAASLLALLSHPAGLLVLPLTVLVVLAAERTMGRASSWAWLAGISLAADAAWLGTKYLLGPVPNALQTTGWNFGLSFFQYLRWMALPAQMSVDRSTTMPGTAGSVSAVLAWIGVAVLAGLALWLWKRRPAAAAGLAWTGIALVPFCGLLVLGEGMAERFVFLASAGFALLLVALAAESGKTVQRALVAALLVWTAWGAWRTIGRAGDWTDATRLYTASLIATPDSPILYYNLGLVSNEKGDNEGAERNYKEALRLQPGHIESMLKLALLLEDKREYDASENEFRKVLALVPSESRAYTGLGMLMYEEGHVSDAESMFGAAIRYNKYDPMPYFRMAQLYQEGGDGPMALMMYEKVLKLRPDDADIKKNVRDLKYAMAQAAREEQYQ